jgi:hypothetical protein
LEQERSRTAAGLAIVDRPASQRFSAADPTIKTLPAAIDVEYWEEEDGTWTAHSPLLGVTAVADSEPEVFAELADVVEELWDILNERYATLSEDLRSLLDLRFQSLRFERRA